MAEIEAAKSAKKSSSAEHSVAPGIVVVSSGTDVVMQDAIGSTSSELPVVEAEQPIPETVDVMVIVTAPSWAEPFRDFMVDGILPEDEVEARKIQRRSGVYTIIKKELVHRSVTGVLQCCIEEDKGLEMLRDIHQGECGHYTSATAIVAKDFRHGFY